MLRNFMVSNFKSSVSLWSRIHLGLANSCDDNTRARTMTGGIYFKLSLCLHFSLTERTIISSDIRTVFSSLYQALF
jgi:hypothetical protein